MIANRLVPTPRPLGPAGNAAAGRSTLLLSFLLCAGILGFFLCSSTQFLHWFILPVFLCGLLVAVDAVDWLAGRIDTFDPAGLLGCLGVHFFFFAPLLHVYLDFWGNLPSLGDWRPSLGGMASLNAAGLMVYRAIRARVQRGAATAAASRVEWRVAESAFFPMLFLLLLVSFATQLAIYSRFGGLEGYVSAAESRRENQDFQGMGWVFMISESFPILVGFGMAVYAKHRGMRLSWSTILAGLIVLFVLRLLFGGLRGSRNNTVFAMFWAIGIIHYWIRPIPRKAILAAIPAAVLFMYFYGFYKSAGREGLAIALGSSSQREALAEEIHRPLTTTVLVDLGRTDVQAFVFHECALARQAFDRAWGQTYLSALSMVIPKGYRPPWTTVTEAGTVVLRGTYDADRCRSSRIYGLAGEAMLNFGPAGVVLAFSVLGWLTGRVRRSMSSWGPLDARRLLAPFLCILSLLVLATDSVNVIFFFFHKGAMPILAIVLTARRVPIRPAAPRPAPHETIRRRPTAGTAARVPG